MWKGPKMSLKRNFNWLEVTGRHFPQLADILRQQVEQCLDRDTTLDRKFKELILLASATAMRSAGSVRSHGLAAIKHGASSREVLEAISLAALGAGHSACIEAIEALGDTLSVPIDSVAPFEGN